MSRIIHRNQSQTPCAGRDEDLLMYLHGALPPMARIRTARHLHRCTTCQQRAAALAATSQALADTVRGDALPRWTAPRLSPIPLWLAGGAAVLLLATVSFFTVSLWTQSVQAHTANPTVMDSCLTAESMERHYRKVYAERAVRSSVSVTPKTVKVSPSPSPAAPAPCLKFDGSEFATQKL